MQIKKLIIAIVVFVFLAGLAFFLQKDPYAPKQNDKLPKLPDLSNVSFDKVEIINETDGITFEAVGDDWYSKEPEKYKIDKTFKTLIIDKLAKLTIDRIVSEKKETHDKFEVDAKGTRVKLFSKGEEKLSLIIGKNTPDYRGTFIRLPDSDVVYATAEVLGTSMKRKLKDWRDKSVFENLSKDDITKVSININKQSFSFEKKVEDANAKTDPEEAKTHDEWFNTEDKDFPVDLPKINSLVSAFALMKWSDIEDTPQKLSEYGIGEKSTSITLFKKDGKEIEVKLGDLDEETRTGWLAVKGDPKVYQIRKYHFDKLANGLEYYRYAQK